jgi:hypothetical protein
MLKLYPLEEVSLGTVMAVYRNLRENYEFRLRYDEADEFFIREMELKRNYREVKANDNSSIIVESNSFIRRHLSLTGLYYHFSKYGESIVRPTIIGMATVGISTLFWMIQNNPTAEPFLPFITDYQVNTDNTSSNFINVSQILNITHSLKAFERSFSDFIPLLTLPSNTRVGVIDYVIKIVGGALTFGLLIIALRRKFERKYTR